jgi:hypothetical protein
MVGLGEREGADLVQGGHGRKPALLLLRAAQEIDRAHRQPGLHAHEGGDAAVAAGQLQGHHAELEGRQPGAAVALDRVAGKAESGELGNQRPWKLGAIPIGVDHRQEVGVDEGAHTIADDARLVGEQVVEKIIVGAGHNGSSATTGSLR